MTFWKFLLRDTFRVYPKNEVNPYAIALQARWDEYRRWADNAVCVGGCGKKASDRKRDEHDVVVAADHWIHEDLCMDCWRKGYRASPAYRDMSQRFKEPPL